MSLFQEKNWVYLWALLTPSFYALTIISANLGPYLTFIYLAMPPAFFGLWLYDKSSYKKEYIKLLSSFLIMFLTIFTFGVLAGALAVLFLLFFFKYIKFSKEQFYWSFGAMFLYLLLASIPLILLFLFDFVFKVAVNLQELNLIAVFIGLAGLILQGFIFAKLMLYFKNRYLII